MIMALEFRDQTSGQRPSGRRSPHNGTGIQQGYGETWQPGVGYGYPGGSAPKKRRGVGAAWIAVPVLCVAAVVILLLSGVLGGTSAPLPETKPTPVETPEPGNEEKPAGELSAIREQAEKIIPGYRCRYLVQQLDDRMLEDFLAIYQAVANFRTEVEFPSSISMDEMEALMTLIYGNCPELFQIDGNATYYYNSVDRDGEKMVTGISELSYHMDEDTYRRAYQQCDRIVQEVVSGAAGLSAREAELHAYRYVTGHCVYDLSTPYCGTPYGALVEGRAKCDGTGKTMQWILEQMGIVCLSISGAPLDGGNGHQWNVAEIDGIFYDLDATADLGNQGDKLLYGRFNVDNHLIRDLYPIGDGYLSCFTIPGTDSMSGSYHARNHTRVESDADCGPILAQQFSQVIQKNGGSFAIQLAQSAQVDELSRIFGKWEGAERFLKEYDVSLQGFGYYSLTQPETNVYQFTVYRDS